MESYFDELLKRAEMVKDWRTHIYKIVGAIKKVLPDAEIYVFGSVLRNEIAGGSDVDVLVISPSMPKSGLERAKLKMKAVELSGLPSYHPFEIHMMSDKEAERYLRRIKDMEKLT